MHRFSLSLRFAVYVDFTKEPISRPFYVGKGTEWRVNNNRSRNGLYKKIRKDFGVQRRIVFETNDEAEAYAKERELILFHGTHTTWGANLDEGGQGGPGMPKSSEHREKIRQALKGKAKTPEHRKAMSQGGRGKRLTEEHKRKIASSVKASITDQIREARRRGALLANQVRWTAYRLRRLQQTSSHQQSLPHHS